MRIVCIGAGYVGLLTASAFAKLGNKTTVIDVDEIKVRMIQAKKAPFYEPGLEELLLEVQEVQCNLDVTTSYHVVREADIIFIAVGTPSKADGAVDLSYIKQTAINIADNLAIDRFTVIVNKSTVPVGTAELVTAIISQHSGLRDQKHFTVISNPEFLREGSGVLDVFYPDRIVVGSDNSQGTDTMQKLYQPLLENSPKSTYFVTDVKAAELIKYASNAFLAVKLSFANELAQLSDKLGVNVSSVIKGMGLDSRIGDKFLAVSNGWGGSCLPKDTSELLQTAKANQVDCKIIEAAIKVNEEMPLYCLGKLRQRLGNLKGKQIGLLGLTFKPETDDVRDTQSKVFIDELLRSDCTLKVHDPEGMVLFKQIYPELKIEYCDTIPEVFMQSEAVLLITHWSHYKELDWLTLHTYMSCPYLLDTRNFWDRGMLQSLGFEYDGLGM